MLPQHKSKAFFSPRRKSKAFFKIILTVLVFYTAWSFHESEQYNQNRRHHKQYRRTAAAGGLVDVFLAVAASSLGFIIGEWWTEKMKKDMKTRHEKEMKQAWKVSCLDCDEIIKEKNVEVQFMKSKLRDNYQKIVKLEEDAYTYGVDVGMGTYKADYKEFKIPDTNNDETVSQEEFDLYIESLMTNHPTIPSSLYPKFDQFDLNGDNTVSFKEWQQFLFRQRMEEMVEAQESAHFKFL